MKKQSKSRVSQPKQVQEPPFALSGGNPRGEVAACPTGLADPLQAQVPQQAGGGGAPGTGAVDPSVPPSPGEGISEAETERAESRHNP